MTSASPVCRACTACLRLARPPTTTPLLGPAALISRHTLAGPSRPNLSQRRGPRSQLAGIRSFGSSSPRCPPKRALAVSKKQVDMDEFPPERIRNLSIIAHIDHGKSTLADRLLQMTNTVPLDSSPQFLDKLKVERDRGITVKAQTVSIIHTHTDGKKYLINLIDTPGHVDFSYEVSRSLGACEGGLLLVDCSQGIQAQTLSVFHVAQEHNLKLLAVINKVDLPHASPDETSEQIASSLGLPTEEHTRISAKSGLGVDKVLSQIVEALPGPRKSEQDDGKLRALVFDTFYDTFRGVVALVRIFSGTVKKGDKIRFLQADKRYEVLEVGIQNPEEVPVELLKEGQVGYLVCNMKNSDEAHIGDTVCLDNARVEALPGFKPMKAMVYAGVFPMDWGEFGRLEEAIERLTLNDRSVTVQRESSAALSQGFRLGFLGTLHMDVFRQRLEDEYSSEVIITAPTVPYKVIFHGNRQEYISNPAEFPDTTDPKTRVIGVEEPMVNSTIFVPVEYIGAMMDLGSRYRGLQQEYRVLEASGRAILRYKFPLSEIVTDFFSELKSASSGFASFDYEDAGYEASDMVKLNLLLHSRPVDALAMIVHRSAAQTIGRAWVKKLKDVLPRQLFELAIQAAIGSRIVARESLPAMRKDVTAGLYGGHYERKMKQLEKQKVGKKRLKRLAGNIDVPQSAFYDVLSSRPRGFATSARQGSRYRVPPIILPPAQARRNHQSARDLPSPAAVTALPLTIRDPISPNLPSLPDPDMDLFSASGTSHRPIPLPHTSPLARSTRLSKLHRLSSSHRGSPSQIVRTLEQTYADLLESSPHTAALTPAELRSAIQATRRLYRCSGSQGYAVLDGMVKELQRVSSEDTEPGVDGLVVMLGASRTGRRLQVRNARLAERALTQLLDRSGQKTEQARLESNKRAVQHVMYLYASVNDSRRFDMWAERMQRAGVREGSAGALARMIVLERIGCWEEVLGLLQTATADGEERPEDRGLLVNHVMWRAAIRGEWSTVTRLYTHLCPKLDLAMLPTPLALDDGVEASPVLLPDDILPTRATFSSLVQTLAFSGYLQAALTVMSHMMASDHVPHVQEYLAIFKGFARHGQVPPGSSAVAGGGILFPRVEQHEPLLSGTKQDKHEAERAGFGAIWERGRLGGWFGRDPAPHHTSSSSSLHAAENEWTLEAMKELFASFLQLSPQARHVPLADRAPGPRAAWTVLMAFWRMSGGDRDLVREVWEGMDHKFAEWQNEERDEVQEEREVPGVSEELGWRGWRLDGRLERVLRALHAR